jgi:mRNA-degrading endonuclease RelE of RelBE toxin-antitoxin system
MNYSFIITENFAKELKSLAKKYASLKDDVTALKTNIEKELNLADDLGEGFKKIRLNIKSKGRGKSGGARIITYEVIINVDNTDLYFGSIYDKNQFDTIDIAILKKNLGIK